jgi:DNA helicase-2/ATP-dependent DNA helicase PcrA
VAEALDNKGIAHVRTDGNALVKRSSRLARFVEASASWVTGGWREANPPYARLLGQALALVYGGRARDAEEQALSRQLIAFLRSSINSGETTHSWLKRLCREVIAPWQMVSRNPQQEWETCTEMMVKTDPAQGKDMPLNVLSGRIEGTGRVSLSTLHSAKGREFDAVILYGMNSGDIPSSRDRRSPAALREARRLFYVGVTRPRKELSVVYQEGNHSPWVAELYQRSQQS